MKKITFAIALLSVMMFSCKKEEEINAPVNQNIDTIMPQSYYPVYPGSWWTYQINDTGTVTSSVSAGYQLHSYLNGYSQNSTSVYVPFLDGRPIYGYDKIEWHAPPFGSYYAKWPILSETVGFTFDREWTDKRYGDFAEKVEVQNKIFNGTDSVLILEGHWVYGPNIVRKSYQEYVKGVGLTKHIVVDTLTTDTVFRKILTDHFVNH